MITSDDIIAASAIVTAIATVAIGINAWVSHKLLKKHEGDKKKAEDEFHELIKILSTVTLMAPGRYAGQPESAKKEYDSVRQVVDSALKK